jgi:flagellar biosynthesis component FlhA
MEERDAVVFPIVIELGQGLRAAPGQPGYESWLPQLSEQLATLLARYGVVGTPTVTVVPRSSERAVRILVHGRTQAYPPSLLTRVWLAVAGSELHGIPGEPGHHKIPGFPDHWLSKYVSSIGDGEQDKWPLVFAYLTALVREVLQLRPSCLMSLHETVAYLGNVHEQSANDTEGESTSLTPSSLLPILQGLLNLWVRVTDRKLILDELRMMSAIGCLPEDTVEDMFARLRSITVSIHLHPDHLRSLQTEPAEVQSVSLYAPTVNSTFRDHVRSFEDSLFASYGVQLPDLVLVPTPLLSEVMVVVQINDRPGIPFPLFRMDQLLAQATPTELAELGVAALPYSSPVGMSMAVVSDADQEKLTAAGIHTSSSIEAVLSLLSLEIRAARPRLLSIEDIEWMLAQLEAYFPLLIQAISVRYSTTIIARTLRELLAEGISIYDLKTILEMLLEFDVIPIVGDGYEVIDDRLSIPSDMSPTETQSWRIYFAYLRYRAGKAIKRKYEHLEGLSPAYKLSPELERRIVAAGRADNSPDAFTLTAEDEHEAIRDLVWYQIDSNLRLSELVIVASSNARREVWELLSPEFPNASVLSMEEWPQDAHSIPLG